MMITGRVSALSWLLWLLAIGCGSGTRPPEGSGLVFRRAMEPREGAFSLLAPDGWLMEGGLYRVNAAQAGGPLNAIEAKCDLTLKSDAAGTVALRILPDIVYAHVGIGAGMWGAGRQYQGATVKPLESAQQHIRTLFQAVHPGATDVRFLKLTPLRGEIESMEKGMAFMNALLQQVGGQGMTYRVDAAGAVVEYEEGGRRFREVWCTGIVDQRAALTWKNTRTLRFRAPVEDFERWKPVMDIVRFSVRFNPSWVLKEAQGQKERADFVIKVYDEIRRLDAEIAARNRINREEIMNGNCSASAGRNYEMREKTRIRNDQRINPPAFRGRIFRAFRVFRSFLPE